MNFQYCPCCAATLTSAQVDLRERRVCSKGCGYVLWNNPIPVVAALIFHAGRAILVRQANWPQGWFGLVTGFLEKAEEPADGIVREIQEELGLRSTSVEWIGEFAYPEQNQLILAYAVECEGELNLSEELSDVKYINIDQLRPWPFGTGKAVHAWLKKQAELV